MPDQARVDVVHRRHVLARDARGLLPLRLARVELRLDQLHAVLEDGRAAAVGGGVAREAVLPIEGETLAVLL